MKEATGEANMTVVTVILVGLVLTAAALLIPNLLNGVKARACCSDAGGNYTNGQCSVNISSCMAK
jgi:hypothetical protein